MGVQRAHTPARVKDGPRVSSAGQMGRCRVEGSGETVAPLLGLGVPPRSCINGLQRWIFFSRGD